VRPRRPATRRVAVRRVGADGAVGGRATLAVEAPLEVLVDGRVLATTMRTPGDDLDLALGFAITDGGVDPAAVATVGYCGGDAAAPGPYGGDYGAVQVATRSGAGAPVHRHRATAVTSACGICGADVLDDLLVRAGSVADDRTTVAADVVAGVGAAVRAVQRGFEATGAMHAAAAVAADGAVRLVREDVGRHNAVDKLVGAMAAAGDLPARGALLSTSGRIAFEIVAKALVAGFPVVVAPSAPTSLAVEAADAGGQALVGFARGGDFTVYTHPWRIVGA
jgi:FdhD protein